MELQNNSGISSFAKSALTILSIFIVLFLSSCETKIPSEESYIGYIEAYTSGPVSRGTVIRIRLRNESANESEVGKETAVKLFNFDPEISGKAFWADSRTVEFYPDKMLPSGTHYKAEFYLSKVTPDVEDSLKTFYLGFSTFKQDFKVRITGIGYYDEDQLEKQYAEGTISLADIEDTTKIKSITEAYQGNKKLELTYEFLPSGTEHKFRIENITRKPKRDSVAIKWNGKEIVVDRKGGMFLEIPGLSEFRLTRAEVIHGNEKYIQLEFSDPLSQDQDLSGLIRIQGISLNSFSIDRNNVNIYPPYELSGEHTIFIEPGMKNKAGYSMEKSDSATIVFEVLKPALRNVGKGVIMPATDGLVLPFEAVNLRAVDVRIIKVYENNIMQFLQVNSLGGSRELKRVGRPDIRKRIMLDQSGIQSLNKWNLYTLDLSKIIKADPGALYRVTIDFRKEYSTYECPDSENSEKDPGLESWDEQEDEAESSFWDYADTYYYGNWSGYEWEQRDNPCNKSYYMVDRSISRNIIASNIGLIAKAGSNNILFVAANDIRNTKPLSGVKIEVYNYQQQLLVKTKTDSKGFAEADLPSVPFIIKAEHNKEKAYLKLDDGSSLSMSNFNVSGVKVKKGLKGYLYGERGVWRPGDSLYLTFILEDSEDLFPVGQPLIFELFGPRNKLRKKIIKKDNTGGFYNFSTATDPDAPTGNWRAKIKAGGAVFENRLRIETVKPNRLKIKLDFGVDKITKSNNKVSGQLKVNWLHGAIAKNLKAVFNLSLRPGKTEFNRFSDYIFDDPVREFDGEPETIFRGKVDDKGQATVSAILTAENAPGKLIAKFDGKVFEESGDFSVDEFSIPFYPYKYFVGLKLPQGDKARGMLLTDTNHIVRIATVDEDGNPVSRKNIEIQVYKLKWRWWWETGREHIASYLRSGSYVALSQDTISTKNGKGTWKLRINYPDWGRYLVRVCDTESGHCSGKIVYIDWPGWAGRAKKDQPGGTSILSFSADKEKYKVGEKIRLNIPGSKNGRALITIENGKKVIDANWMETVNGENIFEFKATPEMSPNVYAYITLLQPHLQTVNDLPIRLYGVLNINIENPKKKLSPKINMPDKLAPESKVKIRISEENGKAMNYTLAIVDEGLLDLTRFKTPDPYNQFFAREALGVKTWDLYEDVIGAYAGKLNKLLAVGGGKSKLNREGTKANRFKPMVRFIGPFELKKGKTNTHYIDIPNYIGSVRTMVVAGKDGSYGSTEKTTPVKKALMVLGTLPRVLGPEETVNLPVTVFAMEKYVKNVKIKIKADDKLELLGSTAKNIRFSEPGEMVTDFRIKVKPVTGVSKIRIEASSGKEKAYYDFEIYIRNPNPPVTEIKDYYLKQGESINEEIKYLGMKGTNSGTVEVSVLPPLNLTKHLRYLIRYPYGCLEQVTSSVFPQLYVSAFMETDGELNRRIQKNVKAGIKKLGAFRNNDGGFSYWPGQSSSDEWASTYAGHFLLEAKKHGYSVPSYILDSWKKYQTSVSDKWYFSKSDALVQAYRLYTLTLAKAPNLGAMNRLRERKELPQMAKWSLAAAYVTAGRPEAAKDLTEGLSTKPGDKHYYRSYGSELRDKAIILNTLGIMNETDKGFKMMREISNEFGDSRRWFSTQTTAFCLIAIASFGPDDKQFLTYSLSLNNKPEISRKTNKRLSREELPSGRLSNRLKLKNNGKKPLYVRVILDGMPVRGTEKAEQKGLEMSVSYQLQDGSLIKPKSILQGTDFKAVIKIKNITNLNQKNLALTQIFPSGWEITQGRIPGSYDYRDVRDDRVSTFFDLKNNETKTFEVSLNAAYGGKFYLPMVLCEAMYDNSVTAKTAGREVTVERHQ